MSFHANKQRGLTHHLSKRGVDRDGWVESLSDLTEEHGATSLLNQPDVKPAGGGHATNGKAATNGGGADSCGGGKEQEVFDALAQHAVEAVLAEVAVKGELIVELGTPESGGPSPCSDAQLDALLQRLTGAADGANADVTVLRRRKLAGEQGCASADVLVRARAGARSALEVRVAVIGNVDSGKSTMVGVLTRSMLDDGRGGARSKVFKHGHEEATGRTSSIGQHNLCLSSKGVVLNDPAFRSTHCGDYVRRASKVVTLVDLAGHERYFKTTAYGLTGHLPDYACLIVGANAGLVGMCKEHLGVALALKMPVYFVVTKVDIAPEHVLQHTLSSLTSILKKPGVRKKPFVVRTADDVVTCARLMASESLAPIILTSAVTGMGLDLIRSFVNLLPQREDWAARAEGPAEFIIDETFGVPGVGTVVAGTVKRGVIASGSSLLLGPDLGDGSFRVAGIKSIHYKRLPVAKVVAGQTAALALKKVKRSAVRKGMVLVDERAAPVASWEFDADIAILTHSTTIQPRYQAVIHCEIVRQAACVVAMDRELLRSCDRATVRFRFLQRPEYLTPGSRFVFREGRTKGIGVVVATQ